MNYAKLLLWSLICLFALGLIFIPFADAKHISEPFKQVQCSLISEEPYYDCSQPLIITVFDTKFPPLYNVTTNEWYLQPDNGPHYLAYAYYNIINDAAIKMGLVYGFDAIVLGNMTMSWITEGGNANETMLAHEIRHVICECDFHPETTKELKERRENQTN